MTFDIEKVVWTDHFAGRQQSLAGQPLGPSGVGSCYRQQAYDQLGAPVTNPEDTSKADAGSLYHYGIQQILSTVPGVFTEVPVRIPGLRRVGNADVVKAAEHLLVDIKTYSGRAWQYRIQDGGPYLHQWHQCELYGLGLYEQAGDGVLWTLQVLGINRDTGEHEVWTKVQDLDLARGLADRLRQRQYAIAAAQVEVQLTGTAPEVLAERFPREGSGPGRGFPCDWCAFTDLCWPAPVDPLLSPQSATVVDNPEAIEALAAQYRAAADMESEAKRLKYDAQAFLRGITGTFGEWTVRQSKRGTDTEVPDPDTMRQMLTDLGQPIPMLTKPGKASYPIVSRAKGVR